MKLLDVVRRPAVRIPILLAVTVVLGAFAARSCLKAARTQHLVQSRHLRFMEMVFRLSSERAAAGRRPKSLAEVAAPYSCGEMSAIEDLYLREYARLPEFGLPASKPAVDSRLTGLGRVEIQGEEIFWEGYCYRLWNSPGNARDFVVVGWPKAPGVGRLTEACLSTEPGRLYYTFALRYAGAGKGPQPEDLGDPFAGKVKMMDLPKTGSTAEAFLERAGKSNGREWAMMSVGGESGAEAPTPERLPLDPPSAKKENPGE